MTESLQFLIQINTSGDEAAQAKRLRDSDGYPAHSAATNQSCEPNNRPLVILIYLSDLFALVANRVLAACFRLGPVTRQPLGLLQLKMGRER